MMIRKPACGNLALSLENLDALKDLAEKISKIVSNSDFIALTGDLGTGKTTFTQFFCQSAGVVGKITSPTFTLLNEYKGDSFTIFHGDLYRLTDAELPRYLDELEALLDESEGVVLMEWADKAPDLAYRWTWHLHLESVPGNPSARRVHIQTDSPDLARLEALFS